MSAAANLLAPERLALIVVDLQNDYCSPDGHMARHGQDIDSIRAILPCIRAVLARARSVGALIVFTQQTAYPGGIGDSPARAHFKEKAKPGLGAAYPLAGSWGHAVADVLQPVPGDLVLPKCRSSAFFGTPLDTILRAGGRSVELICGAVTEGCVESTLRDAANHDYIPVLLADCVASNRADLHEAALTVMRGRYDACSSDAVFSAWSDAKDRGGSRLGAAS